MEITFACFKGKQLSSFVAYCLFKYTTTFSRFKRRRVLDAHEKKKLVHLNEDVARNRTEKQDNNTLVLHWYVTSNLPGYQEATRNIFIARIVI